MRAKAPGEAKAPNKAKAPKMDRLRQGPIDAGRLIHLVDEFEGRRIAVFGDLIVDDQNFDFFSEGHYSVPSFRAAVSFSISSPMEPSGSCCSTAPIS